MMTVNRWNSRGVTPQGYAPKRQQGDPAGTPLGQRSAYWNANPYQNQYAGLMQNYGNLGNKLIGSNLNAAGSPESWKARFGWKGGPGPNDPALGQWMANLTGNQAQAARSGVNQMAAAGVGSTRGGFGVGGPSLRSQIGAQATRNIADRATQNFDSAVRYETNRRGMDNTIANSMAQYAGKQMDTGLGLLGLQLQGAQSADRGLLQYLQMAGNAFNQDTTEANQYRMTEPDRWHQEAMRERQLAQLDQQQKLQQRYGNTLAHAMGRDPSGFDVSRRDAWGALDAMGSFAREGVLPGWY
jgi:hypothetical protein